MWMRGGVRRRVNGLLRLDVPAGRRRRLAGHVRAGRRAGRRRRVLHVAGGGRTARRTASCKTQTKKRTQIN